MTCEYTFHPQTRSMRSTWKNAYTLLELHIVRDFTFGIRQKLIAI